MLIEALAQGGCEHLVHGGGDDEGHLVANVRGDFFQVLLVFGRDDDGFDARAVSGDDLFLESANR